MNMKQPIRILIVEDDMIIAANLSMLLTNLGYEITGVETKGEQAIVHAKANLPDILLLDISLKGTLDGIDTAKGIQQFKDIPIIYLTANNDDVTFGKAKETHPKAFITKPFNKLNLQRTIELVADQLVNSRDLAPTPTNEMEVMGDRVFVRHNGKMEKLLLEDILYIEADRNYCKIVTQKGNFLLTSTLKTMEDKLPQSGFIRAHRSYLVSLSKLDVVTEHHLEIDRKVIPLGKSYKDLLLSRIQMI